MRTAVAPERWLVVLVLVCAPCATGCGLIGLGLGAAVPTWEEVPPDAVWANTHVGGAIDVHLRAGAATREGAESVSGSYGGQEDVPMNTAEAPMPRAGRLLVSTGGTTRRIPFEDISRVDFRSGSYWSTGLTLGVAIDAVVATMLVAFVVTSGSFR
jgi:hypothetical protein